MIVNYFYKIEQTHQIENAYGIFCGSPEAKLWHD